MARTPKSATKSNSHERSRHRTQIELVDDASANVICTPNRRHTRAMAKQSEMPPPVTPVTTAKKSRVTSLTAKKATKEEKVKITRRVTVGVPLTAGAGETLVANIAGIPLANNDTDSDTKPPNEGQSIPRSIDMDETVAKGTDSTESEESPKNARTVGRFVRPIKDEPANSPTEVIDAVDVPQNENVSGNGKHIFDLTESPMPKAGHKLNETFEESPTPPKAAHKLNETFEEEMEDDKDSTFTLEDENIEHEMAVTGQTPEKASPEEQHSVDLLQDELADTTVELKTPNAGKSAQSAKGSNKKSVGSNEKTISARKNSSSIVRTSGRFVLSPEITVDDSPEQLNGTFDAIDDKSVTRKRKSIIDLTESPMQEAAATLNEALEEKVESKKDVPATKSSVKNVPNFKNIHKKEFAKSASIADHGKTIQERAKLLTSGKKKPDKENFPQPTAVKSRRQLNMNGTTTEPKAARKVNEVFTFSAAPKATASISRIPTAKSSAEKKPDFNDTRRRESGAEREQRRLAMFKSKPKKAEKPIYRTNRRFELMMKFRGKSN